MQNPKRSRAAMRLRRSSALAAAFAVAWPGVLLASDNWINPAGGSWTTGTNWSEGSPPGTAPLNDDSAQFSQNSSAAYTVTSPATSIPFLVQNDQLNIVNLQASSPPYTSYSQPPFLNVSSGVGQNSSLTLTGGQYEVNGSIQVGGPGGVSSLTLNSFSIYGSYEDSPSLILGGAAGSVTNFSQTGGNYQTEAQSINLENSGSGVLNVTLSGATYYAGSGQIYFNATTTTIAGSELTSPYGPIIFAGNASVSSTAVSSQADNVFCLGVSSIQSSNLAGEYLCVGTASDSGNPQNGQSALYPATFPATGGTSGSLNISGGTINASSGVIVGSSGATGTLIATGTTINASSANSGYPPNVLPSAFSVGIGGTGMVHLSAGVILNTGPAFIGFNGGTGAVTLSGAATTWTLAALDEVGPNQYTGANASIGSGSVELDTGAKWIISQVPGYGNNGSDVGGGLALNSGASLSVLSGARVNAAFLADSSGSTTTIGLDGVSTILNGQIDVNQSAGLAGTLDVIFENGFQPTVGEPFQLFTFGSESGQFSTLNLPTTYTWNISQLYADGIVSVTAVPEPVRAASIIALAAATLRRRRS